MIEKVKNGDFLPFALKEQYFLQLDRERNVMRIALELLGGDVLVLRLLQRINTLGNKLDRAIF